VISAVVPTFRGQARLARNLGSVVAALEATGSAWEVVIVDDGGGGIRWDERGVRVLALPDNRGYGPAVNEGVAEAQGEYLLVLNDDVRLERDCVARLLRFFPDPTLFAVVPAVRSPLSRCGDEGGKAGEWKAGLIEIHEAVSVTAHPTLYAVGCCFVCPRTAWDHLGGYDPVFAPFLWEDVDLSFRAWRHGLQVLHAPEAVCHHEGSATLREHRTLPERDRIHFRNRVLFHLRNLRDSGKRAEAFGALAAFALFDDHPPRLDGLREALATPGPAVPASAAGRGDEDAILERSRAR
jgi:GT2 family glycosyltransferase